MRLLFNLYSYIFRPQLPSHWSAFCWSRDWRSQGFAGICWPSRLPHQSAQSSLTLSFTWFQDNKNSICNHIFQAQSNSQPGSPAASSHVTGIILLFSAGTFLYIATVHVLPELIVSGMGRIHYICTFQRNPNAAAAHRRTKE